ncbi:MAG TPA: hypothetical protein VII87_07525, partial [Solirubrobacteraceae bacterium]
GPPNSFFGPRATEEINWAAHDPTTLAQNLASTNLIIYTGNGQSGPYDSAIPNPLAGAIEAGVEQLSILFHNRLQALGIPSTFDDYGPGTHSWPYWTRDLQWAIGPLMTWFAHPDPTPKAVTYMSADPAYSVYGWSVTMHRAVREFSVLAHAGPNGFTLRGSGSATVLTPARYARHARYRVTEHTGDTTQTSVATTGAGHRLRVTVALGPSNTVQEYPADGPAVGTTVSTSRVSFTWMRPTRHHARRQPTVRRRART